MCAFLFSFSVDFRSITAEKIYLVNSFVDYTVAGLFSALESDTLGTIFIECDSFEVPFVRVDLMGISFRGRTYLIHLLAKLILWNIHVRNIRTLILETLGNGG